MKGYPLGTGQTLLAIWAVLLTLFILWAIVVPLVVQTVRKVRADRAWLRARAARAARKSVEERYVDPGRTVRVLPGAAYLNGVRLFDAQAEANRLADPAWFVPAERPDPDLEGYGGTGIM